MKRTRRKGVKERTVFRQSRRGVGESDLVSGRVGGLDNGGGREGGDRESGVG